MTYIVLGLSLKLLKGKTQKKSSLIQARLIYFVEITNGPHYSGDRRVSLHFSNSKLIRSIPAARYEQNAPK